MHYKPFSYTRLAIHISFALSMLFLQCVGDNYEPLALALVYAMPLSGLSPLVASLSYFLVNIIQWQLLPILLSALQALFFAIAFLLHNRLQKTQTKNIGFFPLLALSLSLGTFVAFSPFDAYLLPFSFLQDFGVIPQKILISAFIFLLSAVFTVALKALLKKFLKCRLKGEEIVFSVLLFVLVGVGICKLLSVNVYTGIAFFLLLVFAFVTKDASTLVCAFTLSLPPALVAGISLERFFIYGVAITLLIKSGRLAGICALLVVFFAYGYIDGLYAFGGEQLVQTILSALLPCLLFLLLPAPLLREMEKRLVFYREKHLSRVAINRNRSAIGKQLYEISAVFREIESTFSALGTNEAEDNAKQYIKNCVVEEACKNCPQYRVCLRKELGVEIDKLVNIGCMKGKTSLVDVPKRLADFCFNQSNVLYAVNRRISEYKKYMLETENAASGRALLAGQAQGVSEILRNLALEQSEPLQIYTERERALNVELLKAGIVCSEVLVYGEENNPTLSLITFGKSDVKKIADIASYQFGAPMIISERLTLSNDKFCCILRKRPFFDAAFGVSTKRKNGETASGDTHSVIKIDERRFMVALSDGMGSGEYARRISESTISLLESFYRAKMPSETVLSSINKLLTFSKEETFACVDVAIVDLDEGKADIVKIGSPVGFILSGNTIKVLEGSSLPLGILDSLRPDTTSYLLQENDLLLFLSDGITGAFGSTTDLYDTLKNIPIHNPQQLTDLLLEQALQSYGGVAKDDMTAVAVRLFKSVA